MVSSCRFRWSLTCQTLAVDARNRAKTTKFKGEVLEAPVILMPDNWKLFFSTSFFPFLGVLGFVGQRGFAIVPAHKKGTDRPPSTDFRRRIGTGYRSPKWHYRQRQLTILFQDALDHDKGQKSAISARRLHWIFLIFSSGLIFFFSRLYVYFSKEMP